MVTEVPLTDGTNKFRDHPLMTSDFKGGGGSLEETTIETFFLIKFYFRKQYLYIWHRVTSLEQLSLAEFSGE